MNVEPYQVAETQLTEHAILDSDNMVCVRATETYWIPIETLELLRREGSW